jgi:hypothetical protein
VRNSWEHSYIYTWYKHVGNSDHHDLHAAVIVKGTGGNGFWRRPESEEDTIYPWPNHFHFLISAVSDNLCTWNTAWFQKGKALFTFICGRLLCTYRAFTRMRREGTVRRRQTEGVKLQKALCQRGFSPQRSFDYTLFKIDVILYYNLLYYNV